MATKGNGNNYRIFEHTHLDLWIVKAWEHTAFPLAPALRRKPTDTKHMVVFRVSPFLMVKPAFFMAPTGAIYDGHLDAWMRCLEGYIRAIDTDVWEIFLDEQNGIEAIFAGNLLM